MKGERTFRTRLFTDIYLFTPLHVREDMYEAKESNIRL